MTRPVRKTLLAVAACLAVLGGAGAAYLFWPGSDRWSYSWSRYETTPDGLLVHLTTSPCDTIGDAEVVETEDAVEVTVRGRPHLGLCSQLAAEPRVPVRLGTPLGDRDVYDGACVEDADGERADRCRREVSAAR